MQLLQNKYHFVNAMALLLKQTVRYVYNTFLTLLMSSKTTIDFDFAKICPAFVHTTDEEIHDHQKQNSTTQMVNMIPSSTELIYNQQMDLIKEKFRHQRPILSLDQQTTSPITENRTCVCSAIAQLAKHGYLCFWS